MTKKSLSEWLAEYGESHQNPTNRWIHKVCVPLIFISIYWMFFSIPLPKERTVLFSTANAVYILALVFWFRLSLTVGIVFLLIGAILSISTMFIWIAFFKTVDIALFRMALLVFVASWTGQFLGHKIEGKKPSFLKDLQFLLIGPIWIFKSK